MDDRLSELPDAILLLILSSFTMKEFARLGVVSHRLQYIWRCFYRFDFKDLRGMKKIRESRLRGIRINPEERSKFVTWVSRVVDKHLGPGVDEFKVTFDLDKTRQSHVDKWVAFALEKQVKILDLDFSSPYISNVKLHLENHLPSRFATLTSLSLNRVNVSDRFIDCLVRTCLSLENLCVVLSLLLSNVSVVSVSLQHLEITDCYQLESVSISAPKLWSFILYGSCPSELNVRHVPSLSKVCIGRPYYKYSIISSFESLVDYFPQLEHLSLRMNLMSEANKRINNPPTTLMKLKHLELNVSGTTYNSLLGWTSLIGALPSLERLTIKLKCYELGIKRRIRKRDGPPIKSLKTLEICGFIGRPIDLEIATYVIENAIVLEQVIVDYRQPGLPLSLCSKPISSDESAPTRLVDLQKKLPPGVKLIVKPME